MGDDEDRFRGGLVGVDHINGDLEVRTESGVLVAGGRVGAGRANGGLEKTMSAPTGCYCGA